MKVFSVEEANALLPSVRRILEPLQRAHRRLLGYREEAQRAAEGARYVRLLTELASRTNELEALGIQLKDYERGLIDFPSLRDGRVILLCWQLGEGDQVEWWHETDAGFAGRQPL
jgi:hypothetical protein